MGIEEQHLDVLQNIEFAIVSVSREWPDMTDYEVMRALEAVIDVYKAEIFKHDPRESILSEMEVALYEAVRDVCQCRLGRDNDETPAGCGPPSITVDKVILCLKKILKSVNRWNKSGGRTGYLSFIVQYVR